MASEKNITMRQFNGTDYDTLYPKTIAEQVEGIYSKDEILSDNTKNVLGISLNSIPDDAFFALAIGVNAFGFRVKVQTSDGNPVAGAEISGLEQLSTIPLITDENGLTIGISSEDSPTISIKSPYIDQIAPEPRVVSKTNKITDVVFTLSQAPAEIEFSESVENLKFYKTSTIDICAVGGGRSGSGGDMNDSLSGTSGGGGGQGGGVINILNIEVTKSTPCSIQVAGTGGESIITCGNQIFSTETAEKPAGGRGATKSSSSTAGGSSSVYKFNDTSLGLAGSGGGGGGGHSENTSGASGGTPNGGAGGKGGYDTSRGATNGSAGKFPGGGGGGGGSVYNTVASLTTRGGAGAAGIVWMRIHPREE